MSYITFDNSRLYDLVLLGRVAVDFNPVDYFHPLEECTTFKKYVGGSPANIAVGAARHGMKIGFFARVSDDQLGDFVVHFFEKEGIDTSRIRRCENGEKIGLTFTEILSRDESSILMYRNCVADLQLHPDDIDEEYINRAKAILISGTALAESPSREAALKAVALAKKNGVPIIFDSGVRRGQHIFKAIASGADVVAIGRPLIYGLALGGWRGVVSVLDYLKNDLRRVMTLAGTQTIEDIKQVKLRPRCVQIQ